MKEERGKRTEGVHKGCLIMPHFYKFYKNQCIEKGKKPLKHKEFATIIKACNKEIIRLCAEEAEIVRLPFRLGYLQVCRYNKSFERKRLVVDYKRSMENRFPVFFENKQIYGWRWLKRTAILKNKSKYKLEMCRKAKRAVPEAVKNLNREYFGKPTSY